MAIENDESKPPNQNEFNLGSWIDGIDDEMTEVENDEEVIKEIVGKETVTEVIEEVTELPTNLPKALRTRKETAFTGGYNSKNKK